MKRKIWLSILAVIMLVLGVLFYQNYPKLSIISSYSAKKMCSCTFISERAQESIQSQDLAMSLLALSKSKINRERKTVTSSVFGLQSKTAEYRGKLGCVLIQGKDDYKVKFPNYTKSASNLDTISFPYGDKVEIVKTQGIDHAKVKEYADQAFDPEGAMIDKKTMAIVVLHKDSLIYERYAQGYSKDTEMLGWSMTKSIMNAWVGMMVKDGNVAIENNSLFPDWANDDRKNISLNNLLQMSSGLDWSEVYSEISPATKMLYESENNGEVAMKQGLEAEVGQHWEYSSGTSNIISLYLRNQFQNHDDYLKFPYKRIFDKLNMTSAVLETDESGTYIGSSYCYATARDWARFGTLYLRDGIWNKERLLPEGWIDYTKTIVPASDGAYGAHFWTNGNGALFPDAPHTMYSCNGFEGQYIAIIPSKDLIVVRLALNGNFDMNGVLKGICNSVEQS